MQTYSHLLINAVIDRSLQRNRIPTHPWVFLTGAVLPDLPFLTLTLLGEIYYRWFAATPTGESPMIYMHFTLYFTDPLWIAAHNFFHAPFILVSLAAVGFAMMQDNRTWGTSLVWFALGAGVHLLLDTFTHADDGPLLLFPLNWQWRFNSPLSYWDPEHQGLLFATIEHVVDIMFLVYLLRVWRRGTKSIT